MPEKEIVIQGFFSRSKTAIMGRFQSVSELLYKIISLLKRGPGMQRPILICFSLYLLMSGACLAQQDDLFSSEEIFRITLKGEISDLLRDRNGEPEYTPVHLFYSDAQGKQINIPLKVRQRGNFRRIKSNCSFPPLLLNFAKKNTANTVFDGQDKIKLVMPCRDEDYVLQEYFTYKLYNLVTPRSFRVRLVEVVLDDPALRAKQRLPFYGFLLEEEDQLAQRNNMISIKRMMLKPQATRREDFLNMAVFNYLIGNTDWSVQYRQNIKLIAVDTLSLPVTVPYDFDHAGIVGASYAYPPEELKLRSTLERRYRGYCLEDMRAFEAVIAKYKSIKEDMYAVYSSNPLLEKRYINRTLEYLDKFYATLDDPEQLREEFQYPCKKNGTGHIVIKGLNKE